jgi:hypothetical protein
MSYASSFKFPPVFLFDGDMEVVTDADETGQRLAFQSLTNFHELPFTEDGSDIPKSVFEQNDQVIQDRISDQLAQLQGRSLKDLQILKITYTFNKTNLDQNVAGAFIRAVVRYRSLITKVVDETILDIPNPGGT